MTPARGGRGSTRSARCSTAAGAAALLCLPFVLFKANRILPGDPRGLLQVLPAGTRPGTAGSCCCW